MEEIVFVEDLSVSAEPFTTDEVIAAYSGNSIHAVRQSIRTNKADISDFGVLAYEMRKPMKGSKGGRPQKIYHLNKGQATFLITLLDNTPKVKVFKKELVKQFLEMEKELQERRIKREAGKYTTTRLGDAIKERNEFDIHAYNNFHQLAYKIALGKRATEIKNERSVPKNTPATEYLSSSELDKLNKVKNKMASLVKIGLDYHAIKALMSGDGTIKLTVSKNTRKEREGA
ncbi:Rha family transcriptional regulator [Liquorilactobacillus mali]|uniref:Rha family transcriptional regulator n=1 Tax=Liquorilactobacillus mali TaxID=1618 RepID=UPI002350CB5F|nr:Rha family transcriptional regulator [Liquorilactobacillus mali]MDC7952501.1 Rha family transcriptional regulator [Liquorilactobacillus mali]